MYQITYIKIIKELIFADLNNVKKLNRQVNKMHEMVTIQRFLRDRDLFENSNIIYPDPPDCVVTTNKQRFWIEETCVFNKWAKEISTNHYEYECSTDINDYQLKLIDKIKIAIIRKNNKLNYNSFTKKYGTGVLLLRIDDGCFYWQRDLIKIINPNNYKGINSDKFNSIYIYNHPVVMQEEGVYPDIKWNAKCLPISSIFLLYGEEI
jgi:hypothetical protein